MKREKAAKKTAFTKVRRCLLTIIQREDVDSQEIIEKDNRAAERLGDEIEQIEIEYSNAQNRVQKIMDSLSLSRKYDK